MQVPLHSASSILGCSNIRTRRRLSNLRQPALRITLHAPQCEGLRCSSKLPLPFPRGWASPICSFLAAIVCLISSGCAEAEHQILEGPARVIDGDTLEVAGQRVRLFGLDAPEKAQSCSDGDGNPYACGLRSKEALEAKLRGASVLCEVKGRDLYGRNVSRCSVDSKADIGQWLVSNGYAIAYRQYSKAYVDDEAVAQHLGRGIWKGDFEVPADWRREQKNGSATVMRPPLSMPTIKDSKLEGIASLWKHLIGGNQEASSRSCNIKGNISKRGRIMFLPTDKGYDSVKIDTEVGEKWFCNVAEAKKAGWRQTKV